MSFYINMNTLYILHDYPSVKQILILNLKVLRVSAFFISFGTKIHIYGTIQDVPYQTEYILL